MIHDLFIVKGNGPILLTAPHTVYTVRNKNEIHQKEIYIVKIMEKIYKKLGPDKCTIFTWNVEKIEKNNLYPEDPNHLLSLKKNNWNLIMNHLKKKNHNLFFHLDLHALDNHWFKDGNHLDIGTQNLIYHRPNFYKIFKPIIIEELDNLDINITFNDPYIGFSKDFYTVTNQGTLLGWLSMQFEMSLTLRKNLATDNLFLNKFIKSIEKLYKRWKLLLKQKKFKKKTLKPIKNKNLLSKQKKTKKSKQKNDNS